VVWLAAGPGDVGRAIQLALTRQGNHANGSTLMYVGATWCEPCRRFHEATANGALDAALGPLTLVEFDADVDGERLRYAGYHVEMLPYFEVVDGDGNGTGRRLQGSIKGPGSPADLRERLRVLLRP
jgi:thiol-disulfide isomerase/thioredoxin